jgi:6-phosphogluconolactonase
MFEFTWDVTDDLVFGAMRYLTDAVSFAKTEGRRARIALSGGSTPRALFSYLGDHPKTLCPAEISLWWGDERPVPYASEESNFGVASRLWLDRWRDGSDDVHPWPTDLMPDEAARRYADELKRACPGEDPPVFDLVYLGIGPEGHTASLFPDSEALRSTSWTAAPYVASKKTVRLTFTLPILNHARRVVFMAAGEEKRAILDELRKLPSPTPRLPASLVRPKTSPVILTDRRTADAL